MAQSTAARIDAPWLERFPHGFDDPDLQERLQFVGVSAYVIVAEAPTDVGEGLQHLEAMGHGDRPVVVVTADVRAARWCASFKMGVVDLIRPDQLSETTLKRIFASLADRPGRVSGTGTSRYLTELVEHVRGFRRSGRLEVLDSPGGEQHVAWTWGRVTDLSRVTLDPASLPVLGQTERWVYSEVEPPAVAERAEELRDAPRLPCDFPAVAVLSTGSRLCRAINFSPGGMLVTAPELRVGTELRLRVDFGPLGRAELKGVVAHKAEVPRPSVGIDLNGIPAQRQFLERVYKAFEKTLRPAGV